MSRAKTLHHIDNAFVGTDVGRVFAREVVAVMRGQRRRLASFPESLHNALRGVLDARMRGIMVKLLARYLDEIAEQMEHVHGAAERIAEARRAIQDATTTPDPTEAYRRFTAEIRGLADSVQGIDTFEDWLERYLRNISDEDAKFLLEDFEGELRRLYPPRGAALRTPLPTGEPVFSALGDEEIAELAAHWHRLADEAAAEDPTGRRQYWLREIATRIEQRKPPLRGGWQSEQDIAFMLRDVGERIEVPYAYGSEVPFWTIGSTRPDVEFQGRLLEIKNYQLFDPATGELRNDRLNALIVELRRQVGERVMHATPETPQGIILDLRGLTQDRAEIAKATRRIVQEVNDVIFEHLSSPEARRYSAGQRGPNTKPPAQEIADNDLLRSRMLDVRDVEVLLWDAPPTTPESGSTPQ